MTTHSAIALALTLAPTSAASAGSARTDSNGTTTFYDSTGRVTGKARTDGTTTFYDAAGRVTGKAQPRR